MVSAPSTEGELLERAGALAGLRLREVAEQVGLAIPTSSVRGKGFAGTLLELALGATAASRPEPDFQLIGVEMKTLPISADGRPRESTYVCTVPLTNNAGVDWSSSTVCKKLARVLWVPILTTADTPLAERTIATPLLWSPSPEQEHTLRRDWEELMDMVVMGEVDNITAHHGTWLQIRPKAADSRARTDAVSYDGTPARSLPRGFYLRTTFTEAILKAHYVLP